jgi:hypothetical protein
MKKTVVAGIVVGVFLLGLVFGSLINGGSASDEDRGHGSYAQSNNSGEGQTTNGQRRSRSGPGGTNPNNIKGGNAKNAGKSGGAGEENFHSEDPNRPAATRILSPLRAPKKSPEGLGPGALAEGERVKRELAEGGGKGNGRVTTLVYDFDSPQDQAVWEAKRRKRWQDRVKHEMDIKIRVLQEKVGLTNGQAQDLRQILAGESRERIRLVDLLTAKKISRNSFDEGVLRNVSGARKAVKDLLSEHQYTVYLGLKPREQVLRDEVK